MVTLTECFLGRLGPYHHKSFSNKKRLNAMFVSHNNLVPNIMQTLRIFMFRKRSKVEALYGFTLTSSYAKIPQCGRLTWPNKYVLDPIFLKLSLLDSVM